MHPPSIRIAITFCIANKKSAQQKSQRFRRLYDLDDSTRLILLALQTRERRPQRG